MKTCSKCKERKPFSDFHKDKYTSDGCRVICKSCVKAHFQAFKQTDGYQKRQKRSREQRQILKAADPVRLWAVDALGNARARSKKSGCECSITVEDIMDVVVDRCPLLDIPLNYNNTKPTAESPTLDRKIPSLGYTKHNIAIISQRANRIKNDASIEDIEKLLKNLVQYMNSD